MIRSIRILVPVLAASLLLASCGSEPQEEWKPKRAKPPAAEQAPAEAPAPEKKAEVALPEEGRFLRNPFQSYIALKGGVERPEKVRGPLECCDLSLFRLVAVVAGEESSYALVQAPDGKRYIIKKGDLIGLREGRVVRIDTAGVMVREYTRDSEGKVVKTTDEMLTLPKEKELKR